MNQELKHRTNELLRSGKTLKDFCELLNLHIEQHNSDHETDRQLIEEKRLRHYQLKIEEKYKSFEIPKRSGGQRKILAPDNFLLKIQRILASILEQYYTPSISSHGFIRERSIVTNAELHTNKKYVLNVDLEDFFPSIKVYRLRAALLKPPFSFNHKMTTYVVKFCCCKGSLPQGAATSPILSNIVASNLDGELIAFAKKYKQTYSRYADDITLSGYRRIYDDKFFNELNKVIRKEKFKIKKSKTRIQGLNKRQEVTGIVVNEKLNVNRKYVRELRAMIHYYHTGRGPDNAYAVISGKLEFLKMVKGRDKVYRNLMTQFKGGR